MYSRPSNLLSNPLNKILLRSEHGHCIFLSVLKVLQCGELGDVESFCQGLVDSGIDSCKDTRALGWGRGQPCMTASDTVLAEQRSPDDSPHPLPPDLPGPHCGVAGPWAHVSQGMTKHWHVHHFSLWAEMRLFNLPTTQTG